MAEKTVRDLRSTKRVLAVVVVVWVVVLVLILWGTPTSDIALAVLAILLIAVSISAAVMYVAMDRLREKIKVHLDAGTAFKVSRADWRGYLGTLAPGAKPFDDDLFAYVRNAEDDRETKRPTLLKNP